MSWNVLNLVGGVLFGFSCIGIILIIMKNFFGWGNKKKVYS